MNSTIDNLNFGVIIDDTEFNDQIKKMEAEAKRFNTSMSNLLNLKKQAQQWSQADVENNRRAWQAKVDEERAQERINREKIKSEGLQRKINDQIEGANEKYRSQSRILSDLKSYALGYLSVQGVGQFLTSLIRITGEFEKQKTTLSAMLGDMDAAEQVMSNIKGLAIESPFRFKELSEYAKQLSAFSVPAHELYDTTKMLADVSAGLGVGMDRLILAYGQVRSAAFLRGQEIRQFTEAGIPILDELAKQFSQLEGRVVSTGEVFDKVSKRLVPFEMVAQIFKDMTSEGGKFFNMQEIQAETLVGKYEKLKDAFEQMMNSIGESQSDNIKGVLDWTMRMIGNYEEVGRLLVELVVAYGAYRTALIAVAIATNSVTTANSLLAKSLWSVAQWVTKNPYAAIAAGVTAAAFAIYRGATKLEEFEKIQKSVADTSEKYYSSLAKETTKLDALYAKLNLAKEGTEEYDDAKKQIYTQYGQYIAKLTEEGVAVDNLANIYDNLKEKIEASQKAKFKAIASQEIEQTFSNSTDTLLKQTNRKIKNIGRDLGITFSELEKQAIIAYVSGTLSAEEIEKEADLSRLSEYMALPIFKSVDNIKNAFTDVKDAYSEGLKSIDKLYGDIPGLDIVEPTKVTETGGDGEESEAEKRVKRIIKSIQQLQDAYEKLRPYLNDEQMNKTLKNLFPEVDESIVDSLDFEGALRKLADELEQYDKDAAQSLRDTISKDVAGAIADSFEAFEKFKELLDDWSGQDFDLVGKGTAFDISKIVRDLNNEYARIDQRRLKAIDLLNKAQMGDEKALQTVRETLGEEVWQKYLENGVSVINELADKEKKSARAVADEKIRDLADKDLKERMEKQNIDLSEFDEKTLSQVRDMIDRLMQIRDELLAELATLEEGGITIDESANVERLKSELEKLGVIIDDTGDEYDKKVVKRFEKSAEAISKVGNSIAELGDAMGSSSISALGGELAKQASAFSEMVQAMQAKDVVALISNIVAYAASSIADIVNATYEAQERLNDAMAEYYDRILDIRRESHSGIFGDDEMNLASENASILAEATARYQDVLERFNKSRLQGTNARGGGWENIKNQSLADILGNVSKAQGWDLYLADGQINIDALESYYDAFSDRLSRKQKRLVEELIESGNALDDASAQQAEYLKSLYGDVADTIADNMVNAFIESGDAAIDMGELVSNTAKSMVADLIKSLYILPILNEYEDQALAIQKSTALTPDQKVEAELNLLETALGEITQQEGKIEATLERFSEYLGDGKGGENGLSEGIKGMTEDTANLLASYLNAIRADVAYSKVLWQRMDANTQAIANSLVGFSAPSLMDYQKRIEANTYNNMIATQSILARLNELITYEDGPASMRVLK